MLAGFDTPTLVGPPDPLGLGPRDRKSVLVSEETTQALGELARSHQTTVSTVLQAAFAHVLSAQTGQRDVAFGSVVSGRSADVVDADSMVGLLINTVPVRANLAAATTTTELLNQLQASHNATLEHQHLALSDIHRMTGQKRLFDTVFVFENYPTGASSSGSPDELAVTEVDIRDFYHYPLTIQAVPGRELDLRVQFRTDVFDDAEIAELMERFEQVLKAMIADPAQRLSPGEPSLGTGPAPVGRSDAPVTVTTSAERRAPATLVEQLLVGIYAQVLGVAAVGVDESFFDLGGASLSALRAIAEINTAFDVDLPVNALFETPSVSELSQRLADTSTRWKPLPP